MRPCGLNDIGGWRDKVVTRDDDLSEKEVRQYTALKCVGLVLSMLASEFRSRNCFQPEGSPRILLSRDHIFCVLQTS
jgi:hypothetical protein